MSSLNDLKSRHERYQQVLNECPPVSKQLLAHLDKMFARKQISPTSPSMQQELVFQAGCDKVISYLRTQNERQENEEIKLRTK